MKDIFHLGKVVTQQKENELIRFLHEDLMASEMHVAPQICSMAVVVVLLWSTSGGGLVELYTATYRLKCLCVYRLKCSNDISGF